MHPAVDRRRSWFARSSGMVTALGYAAATIVDSRAAAMSVQLLRRNLRRSVVVFRALAYFRQHRRRRVERLHRCTNDGNEYLYFALHGSTIKHTVIQKAKRNILYKTRNPRECKKTKRLNYI